MEESNALKLEENQKKKIEIKLDLTQSNLPKKKLLYFANKLDF